MIGNANTSTSITCLIVDDDAYIQCVCVHYLRRYLDMHPSADLIFVFAASAEEAISILAQRHIDILLTDVKMPGWSGLDLLDLVRTTYPDMRLYAMTVCPDDHIETMCRLHGAEQFFPKPLDVSALCKTMTGQEEKLDTALPVM